LDGELVACPNVRPDFYALTPRMAHTDTRYHGWTSFPSHLEGANPYASGLDGGIS